MMKTTAALCLSCWLAILSLSTVVLADSARNVDELAEQIRTTDQQLDALRLSISQNTSLKRDLQAEYKAVRQKRDERDQRLQELSTRIDQFDQQLQTLEHTLAEASVTISQRKSLLAQSLSVSQSIGNYNKLKILLQQDEAAQAQRLATYRSYLFKAQEQQVLAAIEYLEEIEEVQIRALQDRNWLNFIRDKATSQRKSYADSEKSTQNEILSVEETITRKTRTVAQLQQDQQRLQSLLTELEEMQRGGSGYFATQQGDLDLPADGKITARFGDTKSVGKLHWQGLFIEASRGSNVRAVADGEVVYSDWLQGFGMLVIVDHGDSYMTLYGGNRSLTQSAGSWVESGSTIATVGDAGGQNNSGLYFEIRHNAMALDPTDWLNIPASSL